MKVCTFCDVWGSSADEKIQAAPLKAQLEIGMDRLKHAKRANKFLAYFQSYTTTFTRLHLLKSQYQEALEFQGIVGLVTATRPDCISEGVLDLWKNLSQKTYISIEIGAQSFFDEDLEFLSRGHTTRQTCVAIEKISKKAQTDCGVHLIFGLPGETTEKIIQTAKIINFLPIHNVKLHHLHVLKGTPLEKTYLQGEFSPISLEDYADRVMIFLSYLRPTIYVHRLAAVASRWDELVAPSWTADSLRVYQYMLDMMKARDIVQGKSVRRLSV